MSTHAQDLFSASPSSMKVVSQECLGKNTCSILASNNLFGGDPCPNQLKHLAVVASGCSPHSQPQKHRNVSWVLDFGYNMAGFTGLSVIGNKGARVTIKHAETLGEDGHANNVYYTEGTDYSMKGRNSVYGGL